MTTERSNSIAIAWQSVRLFGLDGLTLFPEPFVMETQSERRLFSQIEEVWLPQDSRAVW